ncbi:hypothetical protein MNBD_ALPHA08-2385 [hydrothermal vent metagenome]|uniref:Uncharacterized protein n=1 Tax=hydrothermal vent metagenome TaxID=652676 RepID=A0A3B0SHN2_9ZZZZ
MLCEDVNCDGIVTLSPQFRRKFIGIWRRFLMGYQIGAVKSIKFFGGSVASRIS